MQEVGSERSRQCCCGCANDREQSERLRKIVHLAAELTVAFMNTPGSSRKASRNPSTTDGTSRGAGAMTRASVNVDRPKISSLVRNVTNTPLDT